MRDDVQASFAANLNIATLLQVCSYTEALARLKAGTVVEIPSDGDKVFGDFMRTYFTLFDQCARNLGSFYICSKRETRKVKLVEAYEAFYRLWRHGTVHEHFPKATSCVTRTSDDGDQPYLRVQANRWGPLAPDGHHTKRLHIHLDYLVNDFIGAATAFERDLFTSPVSGVLRRNCMKRFRFVVR